MVYFHCCSTITSLHITVCVCVFALCMHVVGRPIQGKLATTFLRQQQQQQQQQQISLKKTKVWRSSRKYNLKKVHPVVHVEKRLVDDAGYKDDVTHCRLCLLFTYSNSVVAVLSPHLSSADLSIVYDPKGLHHNRVVKCNSRDAPVVAILILNVLLSVI